MNMTTTEAALRAMTTEKFYTIRLTADELDLVHMALYYALHDTEEPVSRQDAESIRALINSLELSRKLEDGY